MGRVYSFQQQSAFSMQKHSYSMHEETRYSNYSDHQNPASIMRHQHQAKFEDGGLSAAQDAATWHSFDGPETFLMPGFPKSSSSSQFFNYATTSAMLNNTAALRNAEFEAFERVWGPASGTVRVQEIRYVRTSRPF